MPRMFEQLEKRQLLSGNASLISYVGTHSAISQITPWEDGLLFVSGGLGDLWHASPDGTSQLVQQTNSVIGTSDVRDVVRFGSAFYLTGSEGFGRRSVFRTDGTQDGTSRVSGAGIQADNLVRMGDSLFYSHWRIGKGAAISKLDVDSTHTTIASGLGRITNIWPVGQKALFAETSEGMGTSIYVTDATEFGTRLIGQFETQKHVLALNPSAAESGLFVLGDERDAQLWKYDSAADDLYQVATLPGGRLGTTQTSIDNTVFFVVGYSLWKTDGTSVGTVRIFDFPKTPSHLISFQDRIFFFAEGVESEGREVWTSDGTEGGTELLVDIGNGHLDGVTLQSEIIASENGIYFTANDGQAGQELWKSDGTTTGTTLLAAIADGSQLSSVHSLTSISGSVYFAAVNGADGFDLWHTDGTTAGTSRFANVKAIARDRFVESARVDNTTYLLETSGETTYLTHHVRGQSEYIAQFPRTYAHSVEAADDSVFFVIEDTETYQVELWKVSESSKELERVHGLTASYGSSPRSFVSYEGQVYFATDQGVYATDGTAAGTLRLTNQTNVRNLAVVGDHILTYETPAVDVLEGVIRSTNRDTGVASTLSEVKHYVPYFAVGEDAVYYRLWNGVSKRVEIWRTDGTVEDTAQVASVPSKGPDRPIFNVRFLEPETSSYLSVISDTPYFVVDDGTHGPELWTLGSEADSPRKLTSSNAHRVNSIRLAGFQDGVRIEINGEYWTSDGSIEGTRRLDVPSGTLLLHRLKGHSIAFVRSEDGIDLWRRTDEDTGYTNLGNISPVSWTNARAVADFVYFTIEGDVQNTTALWRTDGTVEGTEFQEVIFDDEILFGPRMLAFEGSLFYIAYADPANPTRSSEVLRVTDGFSTSTIPIQDPFAFFHVGDVDGEILLQSPTIATIGDRQMLAINDGIHGHEPWILSRGTAQLLADVNLNQAPLSVDEITPTSAGLLLWAYGGPDDSDFLLRYDDDTWSVLTRDTYVDNIVELNQQVYYSAGPKIWGIDGRLLVNLETSNGTNAAYIGAIATTGDNLIFATNSFPGWQTWKHEVSTGTTTQIATLPPEVDRVSDLVALGDRILFVGHTGNTKGELWAIDSLTAEPFTSLSGRASNLRAVGNVVYFQLIGPNRKNEIWKTDGTRQGTSKVASLEASTFSATELVDAKGTLFFLNHGQLWSSDGTPEGTQVAMPQDLNSVRNIVVHDSELHFTAEDDFHRRGLWRLPLDVEEGLAGDANRDGKVDFSDFLMLSDSFGKQVDAAWEDGDFNLDGFVNFSDFLLLAHNFGTNQDQ